MGCTLALLELNVSFAILYFDAYRIKHASLNDRG